MSDELREAIARAIVAAARENMVARIIEEDAGPIAQAALDAITAAGYRVERVATIDEVTAAGMAVLARHRKQQPETD